MSDLTHLPLNDQIKIMRTQLGMTQIDLAEKLGTTKQSVSSWESGKTKPSVPNIHKMDGIFNSNLLRKESDERISKSTEPYHLKIDQIIAKLNKIIAENDNLRFNYMTAIMENHEYFSLVKKLKNQTNDLSLPPHIQEIVTELTKVKTI
jgi:transcriptional regulator with XRE-family HTH domain